MTRGRRDVRLCVYLQIDFDYWEIDIGIGDMIGVIAQYIEDDVSNDFDNQAVVQAGRTGGQDRPAARYLVGR